MTDLSAPLPPELEPYRGRTPVAIVLGSGFGGIAETVGDTETFPYATLEGYPAPPTGIAGHAGQLLMGNIEGTGVAVFQGRVHAYQGVSALDSAWTSRLAAALGVKTIVLTNAAGGVAEHLDVGDLVLLEDHINLTGDNPLVGWPGPDGGVPFVAMRDAYDPELRAIALDVAAEQGVMLHPCVYAGLLGPTYETPAEVGALRALGADVVGMSTVAETIVARALGLRVLAFSLVTNAAAGADLSHEEVLEAGKRAEVAVTGLLREVLARLG